MPNCQHCPLTNGELAEKIGDIHGRTAIMAKTLEKLDKAVFTGNGEPGLMSRVTTLETSDRKQDSRKAERRANYAMLLTLAGIVAGILVKVWL